jgi:hypothetical protein
VRREGENKLWWALSNKGMFDVSSFYSVIAYNDDILFSWKSILLDQGSFEGGFFPLGWRL